MFEAVVLAASVHCSFQGHPIQAENKANCKRERLVEWAKKKDKENAQYVWAADGPNSFDCSGFTMWLYGRVGKNLPHFSGSQMDSGKPVRHRKNFQKGDLLFYGPGGGSHVAMYIGHGKMIHASNPGSDIRVDDIDSSWYRSRFAGARSYLPRP